jgi:hypoxanthine-guanine phosphoribosyltransferase
VPSIEINARKLKFEAMHASIYKTWTSSTDTVKFIRLQEKQSYTKRYATSENY